MKVETIYNVKAYPAVGLLEEIIERLATRLEAYIADPGVKLDMDYLHKENEVLLQLQAVYDAFNSFRYLAIWKDVENMMEEIEGIDDEISGHAIFIKTRGNSNLPSLIDKYWHL